MCALPGPEAKGDLVGGESPWAVLGCRDAGEEGLLSRTADTSFCSASCAMAGASEGRSVSVPLPR